MNKPPLILVVDDTRADAVLLDRSLCKAGYGALVAHDSETCLRLAVERAPDLVLLDMTMPDRDGLETCRLLKADPRTEGIPVIFVTGHTDAAHIVKAFSAGGSDYVTKPIRVEEILARVSMQVRLRELMEQLAQTNAELARQARVDALTGLLNRSTWEQAAEAEHERSARHDHQFTILMLDVDCFKMLNDSQGHQTGDDCLRAVAGAMARACRKSDIVGRYGGEEFAVLAPETNCGSALMLAERIRQNVWDLALPHPASPAGRVTISIGVAELRKEPLAQVIRRADEALYKAKRGGRNLVCGPEIAVPGRRSNAVRMASDVDPAITAIDFDHRPVVLVVEDNAMNRSFYRGCLGREEYRIMEAADGETGLAAVAKQSPDVIIMDVMMPGIDGFECTRRLKADPATRGIPLIIVSARNQAADVLEGLQAGADEYLTKPVRATELAVRVRSMVRLSRERQDLIRSYQLRAEQVRVLSTLLELCREMGNSASIDSVVTHTLTALAEVTGSRRVSIMLPDSQGNHLRIAGSTGFDQEIAKSVSLPVGAGIAGRVFESGEALVVNSSDDPRFEGSPHDAGFFASVPLLSAPLGAAGEIVGVLNVTERVSKQPFEARDLEYIELMAGIAGAALHANRDRQARDEARDLMVVALAKLAEHRDSETGQHVERVTRYTRILAEVLRREGPYSAQIDDQFLQDLARAVPLHDIGKVAIPDSILRKPGRLTLEEMTIMRTHAQVGADTLRTIVDKTPGVRFLQMAENIIRSHHEWFDGSGYPSGLVGEAIPLCARIVALADVYDALTTDRIYRKAMSHHDARQAIQDATGTQFDPLIVDAFLSAQDEFRRLARELSDHKHPLSPAVAC